jgi:protein required for attachment to host cells
MRRHKIHPEELVVVCDGRKAMILENESGTGAPHLHMREVLEHQEFPTHVLGGDKAGRMHQSVGTARSAVAQTDWHDQVERGFLAALAHHLDAAVSQEPARITLVAAPRALGMLRESCSSLLRHAISEEVGKDLVDMPITQIEKHLQQVKSRLH